MSSSGAGGLGGSTGVNVSALEAKAAAQDAQNIEATQEASEMSMMSSVNPDMTNPAAAARTTKKELKFRPLAERKKASETSEKKPTKSTEEKMQEDLADKHSSDSTEISAQDLRSLRDSIAPDASPDDILKAVQEKFSDPVLASRALDYLDASVSSSDGALKNAIIQAKTTYNTTHKQAIVGGKNIQFTTHQFASELKVSPSSLRQLYLEVTSKENTCKQMFTLLTERYLFPDMKAVTSFLLNGISADMKSEGSSIPSAKLMLLMGEIRNLEAVVDSYQIFESAFPRMQQNAQAEGLSFPDHVNFVSLAESFQKLVGDNYPLAKKCETEVQSLVGPDTDLQSIVLNNFFTAARNVSPRFFESVGKRDAFLTALANALDNINKDNDDYPKPSDFPKPSPWS